MENVDEHFISLKDLFLNQISLIKQSNHEENICKVWDSKVDYYKVLFTLMKSPLFQREELAVIRRCFYGCLQFYVYQEGK